MLYLIINTKIFYQPLLLLQMSHYLKDVKGNKKKLTDTI